MSKMRFTAGDGFDVAWPNQVLRAAEGYGVVEGLEVTLAETASAIELDVESGRARFPSEEVDVGPQTVTLDESDDPADEGRFVAIYVTGAGDVEDLVGDPDEPAPDPDAPPRRYGRPQPPDTEGLDGVVIAKVWLPGGASSSDDLEAEDVIDRRMPAIEAAREDADVWVPNINLPMTALEAGEFADAPIPVPAGRELRILRWGVAYSDAGDPGEPPSDVEVALVGPDGSTVESAATVGDSGTPLVSEDTEGDGEVLQYRLRLLNGSNLDLTEPEAIGAWADYEVR